MTDADKNTISSSKKESLEEHGFFTNTQFDELYEWVNKRIQYILNILIIGRFAKNTIGFQIKGQIVPLGSFLEKRSIIILASEVDSLEISSNQPYVIEINSKSAKALKLPGKKEKFQLLSYVVENTFQKPEKKILGFTKRTFHRAMEYQDRHLNDWHIRVITVGKMTEAGFPQYAVLNGLIDSKKKYRKKINLTECELHADILRNEKDTSISYQKSVLSVYLRKIGFRDYEYHYFEPEILVVILEESRLIKQNIITVKNLTVKFGKRTIINNASFNVRHGSIIGIIGESGAGKSTTVKALLAQVKYKGEISIMGIDAQETKRIAPHIGYVPQELTMIYHEFNAFENLVHFGTQYGLEEREITQKAKNILKDLQMSEYMETPVEELSGGQKRRVSIAVALVHDPTILILDEPTSGLDPMTRFSLWRFLDRINKIYGITLIVISHYLDEIEYSDKSAIYLKDIGFFDYDSPDALKKKLPGGGMALEITLDQIDTRAKSVLEEIPQVEAVIPRGVRIRVLSSIPTEEMEIVAKRKLEQAGIDVYSLTAKIEVDMMDYFTYFSRKMGAGKIFDEKNSLSTEKSSTKSIVVQNEPVDVDVKTNEE
jgi:ABC-2 type transport system ATP-binding protein